MKSSVVSGLGPQGAQGLFDIRPDLTILGKIIGGGMPVGAFGGHRDIMAQLAPEGPVYQAGTLSGNPIAMAAGDLATFRQLTPAHYQTLSQSTEQLMSGTQERATAAKIPLTTGGSMAAYSEFSLPRNRRYITTAGDGLPNRAFQRFFQPVIESWDLYRAFGL